MRYVGAILLGRLARAIARLRKRGGGTAIPGVVVNALAPGYLARTLNSFPEGLVVVSGSAGKSTTTKMLVSILRDQGVSIFTNPSTANISQGLTSALLERADIRGRVRGNLAVLEMDEGHAARLAADIRPRIVVLTNLIVDQIERFHDPDAVARMLRTIAERAAETVVLNGDDVCLNAIGNGLDTRIVRFGLSSELNAAMDEVGYSRHRSTGIRDETETVVEETHERKAVLRFEGERHEIALPARGVHFALDAACALDAARAIVGDRFSVAKAKETLRAMPPVFGRGEILEIRGHQVEFVLVQNPASFQLNIDLIPADREPPLVAFGADVEDPSYFWTTDVSTLREVAIATGSLAYDIALQLEYGGVRVHRIEPNLTAAVDDYLSEPPREGTVKTIVFSAESMRRMRRHLGFAGDGGEVKS